jgi:hypothetical protein
VVKVGNQTLYPWLNMDVEETLYPLSKAQMIQAVPTHPSLSNIVGHWCLACDTITPSTSVHNCFISSKPEKDVPILYYWNSLGPPSQLPDSHDPYPEAKTQTKEKKINVDALERIPSIQKDRDGDMDMSLSLQETKDPVKSSVSTYKSRYTRISCICGNKHREKVALCFSNGTRYFFYSLHPIPWVCRTCGVSRRLNVSSCPSCSTHALNVSLCQCGVCPGMSNRACLVCKASPRVAYLWNLNLLVLNDSLLGGASSGEREGVAGFVCANCQEMSNAADECQTCNSEQFVTIFYQKLPDLKESNVETPFPEATEQWHETPVPGAAEQLLDCIVQPNQTYRTREEEDMEMAMVLSLSMEPLPAQEVKKRFPAQEAKRSCSSYSSYAQKKRKDWSFAFYKDTVINEKKPWWCLECDKLNPSNLVPRKGLGWGAERFRCVHCEAERPGRWDCKECNWPNNLDVYDEKAYNCSTPGQEKPPPPYRCKNKHCRAPPTRSITIYYCGNEKYDAWKERYLFRTKKTRRSLEESASYIDIETFRRQQQINILKDTCGNFTLAKSLIDPEQLDLHPQDIFNALSQMIRTEVADKVIFWLFLHQKLIPGSISDQGEFESLWPKWMNCSRDTKEMCEFLVYAVLSLTHDLPFECWWLISRYLSKHTLKGYNRWIQWKKSISTEQMGM